jgi:hypothetical protein
MSRRVVVMIVEGVTDKIALRGNLNHLVKDKTIEFEPTSGDITSDKSLIGQVNLDDYIADCVRGLISKNNDFTLSDVVEVVQLIDSDGLYIPSDSIIQKRLPDGVAEDEENRRPVYGEKTIAALDVTKERETLENKRFAVRDLLEKKTIDFGRGIIKPYSIFYNSCNLEHAIFDKQNTPNREKRQLANDFADKHYGNDKKFITLFDSLNRSRSWDVSISWNFLKEGFNSLERGSNLIIYLRKLNPELVKKLSTFTCD